MKLLLHELHTSDANFFFFLNFFKKHFKLQTNLLFSVLLTLI